MRADDDHNEKVSEVSKFVRVLESRLRQGGGFINLITRQCSVQRLLMDENSSFLGSLQFSFSTRGNG